MTSRPMMGRLTTGRATMRSSCLLRRRAPVTVNAVDAPTGAMASIRRRFRLFGRR